MTRQALIASTLEQRIKDIAAPLGVTSLAEAVSDGTQHFWGSYVYEVPRTLMDYAEAGSVAEDGGTRFLNHFFNPLLPPESAGYDNFFITGRPSLTWGLETTPIPEQERSLRDAREFLRQSVIASTERERKRNLARLMSSLGHVVHLIQDLGQPQHTRNDSHGVNSWLKRGYEGFVNANLGELPLGGYAPVQLGEASAYWASAAGTGLANYSNRGFVTTGTNFGGTRVGNAVVITAHPRFASPNGAGHAIDKVQITDLVFPQRPPSLIGEVWFVKTPVVDSYLGMAEENPRASTFSIFDEDLSQYGFSWTFTLNRFNFAEQRRMLAPRSVGYSAGLLNHFMRGRLRVEPPATGLYAYVDHASATGFSSIKARVTNDTPNEAMTNGTLVAAVTFHRNNCYTADLFGEFTKDAAGNLVTPCPDYRSKESSVVLSAEQSLSLASGETRELTFTFATPIPMAATDARLQLVYRGALGPNNEEAVVVGLQDIAEPTFLAVGNGTDVFELPGGYFPYTDIIANIAQPKYSIVDRNGNGVYDSPPDIDVRGADIRYEIRVGDTTLATIPALPEGRFARLAVLADPVVLSYDIVSRGAGFNLTSRYTAAAKVNQLDPVAGSYFVGTVHDLRGTRQWSSVTYTHYYPTPVLDVDAMPPSRAADALAPFAMESTAP
jgi:hypothetical protein